MGFINKTDNFFCDLQVSRNTSCSCFGYRMHHKHRFVHYPFQHREARQTACKPGSVPPMRVRVGGDGHSSRTPVAERLMQPTRAAARRSRLASRNVPGCPPLLLGLAPGGVFPAAAVAGGAVRSYRTVSPLPPARVSPRQAGGILSVALSLGSPPPGVTRHRTSVEPGLSSPRAQRRAAIRPSGRAYLGNPDGRFEPNLQKAAGRTRAPGCRRRSARPRPLAPRPDPRPAQ